MITSPHTWWQHRRSGATRHHRLRAGAAGLAVAMSTMAALPATAGATPAPAPVPAQTMNVSPIPFDSELAAIVRFLKAAGVDQMIVQVGQAIIGSLGQLSSAEVAARAGTVPATAPTPVDDDNPLAILEALGVQSLSPSAAPLCTDPTPENPLGLVTAGAGAAAGPWPLEDEPSMPLPIPGVELPEVNLAEPGETAYAFVPAAPDAGPGGTMRVAWLNTTTLEGGFADLEPVADSPLTALLPMLSGVRLTPVQTGEGTILSAVFGTAQNGDRTCYFLPAVGIVDA